MDKDGLEDLLRLVSTPVRREEMDKSCNFEVSSVIGFQGEHLLVNIRDYELMDEKLGVYRLKNEYSHNKYR